MPVLAGVGGAHLYCVKGTTSVLQWGVCRGWQTTQASLQILLDVQWHIWGLLGQEMAEWQQLFTRSNPAVCKGSQHEASSHCHPKLLTYVTYQVAQNKSAWQPHTCSART